MQNSFIMITFAHIKLLKNFTNREKNICIIYPRVIAFKLCYGIFRNTD